MVSGRYECGASNLAADSRTKVKRQITPLWFQGRKVGMEIWKILRI